MDEMAAVHRQMTEVAAAGAQARAAAQQAMQDMDAVAARDAKEIQALRAQLDAVHRERANFEALAQAAAAAGEAVAHMEAQSREHQGSPSLRCRLRYSSHWPPARPARVFQESWRC